MKPRPKSSYPIGGKQKQNVNLDPKVAALCNFDFGQQVT